MRSRLGYTNYPLPDSDELNSIYEDTYKPGGRETDLYVQTGLQTEFDSGVDDDYECQATTVFHNMDALTSNRALASDNIRDIRSQRSEVPITKFHL